MGPEIKTSVKLTDSLLLACLVKQTLDIARNSASTLVNEGILRLVVQQASNSESLLLTTTKNVLPLLAGVPATFTLRQVSKTSLVEGALQVVLVLAFLAHVGLTVRVNDLIAERTDAEIGPLGKEHDAIFAVVLRSAHKTPVYGPKPGDHSRNRTLTHAVRSRDL